MEYEKVGTLFNYIGGKSWLKEKLRIEINNVLKNNKNINSYTEPFSGGLGAFLGIYDILLENNVKKVTLNDINSKIISFYQHVYETPDCLVKEYMKLENKFNTFLSEESRTFHKTKEKVKLKESLKEACQYYMEVRDLFNKEKDNSLENSACLLFLQNHCFNGVYRENSKGNYNTPFNWEAKYFSEEKIMKKITSVNNVFNMFEVHFSISSFEKIAFNVDTLYYLDPPYINEDITENKYNKEAFTVEKQYELIESLKNVNFVYSNHKNDLLDKKFKEISGRLEIKEIPRKNIISASNESRKNDKIEILVSKY